MKFKVMFWAAAADERIEMSCEVEAETADEASKKVWESLDQHPDPFAAVIIPVEDEIKSNIKRFCEALSKSLEAMYIDPSCQRCAGRLSLWLKYISGEYKREDTDEIESIDALKKAIGEALEVIR